MVAAISAAAAAANPRIPKTPSAASRRGDLLNPTRPPLIPSENPNGAVSRKPRTKEITSRYLHSSSKPTSVSSASSSPSSSSSSTSTRRFPSPSPVSNARPSTPKRSQSVDRLRPNANPEISSAAKALLKTTRSLSVSFQGESFFFQTSRAKPISQSHERKPTPERRKPHSATTPAKSGNGDQLENSRAADQHRRWPAARTRQVNPLTRSLDCSGERKDQVLAAAKLLRQSMVFDDGARRASFDGDEVSASSDTDSLSSGSNSCSHEHSIPLRILSSPRGISVPARFWQETNSRPRRLPEPSTPLAPQKLFPAKKSLINNTRLYSPRTASSPRPIRPPSPSKVLTASPSRAMSSPSRVRSNSTTSSSPIGQLSNASSVLSFTAEARRTKKGNSRIEDAHLLRLFYNQYLQWRYVNARADAAFSAHMQTAEKNLYDAWITISDMRDSVTIKRIKLQLLMQNLKLTSILKEQITYLEEWSQMDGDHLNSLSGAIGALKASTLRLPVVGGARADIQEVQNAIGSAVDVMQAMGTSLCSLLSKVQETSSLASELAKAAAHEQALLYQSRDLLSMVAAMHVRQCSLQGHILQLSRKPSLVQL